MSITDELREWAEDNTLRDRVLTTCPPQHAVHGVLETLLRIADHIDAEHEETIQQVLMGEGGVPVTDENMAEYGWYRALCADGEPMLLGDMMEWRDGTFTVHELKFTDGGCTTWDRGRGHTVHVSECRHHHEPTVEDVLREFVAEFNRDDSELCDEEIIERFAAKLRLAKEGE